MNQDIMKLLAAPFPFEDVEYKVQVSSNDKTKGMIVFYIDSRAIQRRLDEVAGPFGWRNVYYPWQDQAQICGISIYNAERDEWIEKQDGAPNTDIEGVMGGLSHSLKRAACVWSIGRYLYQIGGVWAEIEQRGKGSYVKDNQITKLKNAYDTAVRKIFGSTAKTSPQQSAPPVQQPPAQQPPPKAQAQVTPPVTAEQPLANDFDFEVRSVKPSGKSSQLLELLSSSGEILEAYVKASDQGIVPGAHLRNLKLEQKSSNYGQYNLVTDYALVNKAA